MAPDDGSVATAETRRACWLNTVLYLYWSRSQLNSTLGKVYNCDHSYSLDCIAANHAAPRMCWRSTGQAMVSTIAHSRYKVQFRLVASKWNCATNDPFWELFATFGWTDLTFLSWKSRNILKNLNNFRYVIWILIIVQYLALLLAYYW